MQKVSVVHTCPLFPQDAQGFRNYCLNRVGTAGRNLAYGAQPPIVTQPRASAFPPNAPLPPRVARERLHEITQLLDERLISRDE